MSVYPFETDSDEELPRVDDNITEIGGDAINALRDAMFNVQTELGSVNSSSDGIGPSGSLDSLADRINISILANGDIKSSALTSIGLVTLPITNNQVADAAGIEEFKLDLDFSTIDLNTLIQANKALLDSLNVFANNTSAKLNNHIGGSSNKSLRHVGSHIDLNDVPSDVRDVSFIWGGLQDKSGADRTATTVGGALDQINTELVDHQNSTDVSPAAHPASTISVDGSNFVEIPEQINDVQEALEALDNIDAIRLGRHRTTMHSNGVPKDARSQAFGRPDGYNEEVIPVTSATTHVAHGPPGVTPIDNTITGDELIVFKPDNTDFIFDAQFGQVRVGDHVRVNYGNGLEAQTRVESLRYIPGIEWVIRTVKTNLVDTDSDGYDGYDAYVRIDRPLFDSQTAGILAIAPANVTPSAIFPGQMGSLIVGNPRGATALGNGFDPNQLDATHYLLHLELYPNGNPKDKIINLTGIDVTGNAGATAGRYTIEDIVQATNNNFREAGYNYRFIAFEHSSGNFGIMLSDSIGGASFAIINGDNGSGTLAEGAFSQNVVGNARPENFDALGFGFNRANIASPIFQTTYTDVTATRLPTKVIFPFKERDYIVNGTRRDIFAATHLASLDINGDGYWPATISARTSVAATTVEVTYEIDLNLKPAELLPGKTIVVQPTVAFDDGAYQDVDYGRFIIKDVSFVSGKTLVTVFNGIHGTGAAFGFSSAPGLAVNIYFSEDSIGINAVNMVDLVNGCTPGTDYHRFHEIYVTDEGKTFAHERMRMPVQSESSTELATSKWHIVNASPKLRGFLDDTATDLRRFVRLTILSSDGREFTGSIGKSTGASPGIERSGVVTTGNKNVPVRFYDESNVDYIDLVFKDDSTTGGTGDTIMSTQSSRSVDIEIFQTLALDDELLKLATCEVNWAAGTGIDNIDHIKDCRPHGSISETEFTQSAKSFIQAGDRYLHLNGVIRGLSFESTSPDDGRLLFFNGGLALVNGVMVNANQGSVTIPEVFSNGDTVPATVEWAICVNESGDFTPIILTTSKDQFFAEDNVSGNIYYLPSITFTELINSRKDLTLIYTVIATIASVTLGTIDDARRFVGNDTANMPFTWVDSDSKTMGHFRSFKAVKVWLNGYGIENDEAEAKNNKILVKGAVNLTSVADLSKISNPLLLEGDNASKFIISSDKGIKLKSNLTIRNIRFDYLAENGTSGDIIASGNGALYSKVLATDGTNMPLENVLIEDCIFHREDGGRRAPFINIELIGEATLKNVNINRCRFEDSGSSGVSRSAAIAIVHDNSGTLPALMMDCNITNNVCDKKQGIHVISSEDGSLDFAGPGIHAFNVNIDNNSCGVIGYQFSSVLELNPDLDDQSETGDALFRNMGATISNNNCLLITHTASNGKMWATLKDADPFLTDANGYITIRDNTASWIQVFSRRKSSTNEEASLRISGNTLIAADPALLEIWNDGNNSGIVTMDNYAISIGQYGIAYDTTGSSKSVKAAEINGNKITSTISLFLYDTGIFVISGSLITDNIIEGLKASSDGIVIASIFATDHGEFLISNNIMTRGTEDINAYIAILDTSEKFPNEIRGMIVDNSFDKPTIDGTLTNLVKIVSFNFYAWVVERNKNQTVIKFLDYSMGNFYPGTNTRIISGDTSGFLGMDASYDPLDLDSGVGAFDINYDSTAASGAVRTMVWDLPLSNMLPTGVRVNNVRLSASADAAASTESKITMIMHSIGIGSAQEIASDILDFTLPSYTPGTIQVIDENITYPIGSTIIPTVGTSGFNIRLRFEFEIENGSNVNMSIEPTKIVGVPFNSGISVSYIY